MIVNFSNFLRTGKLGCIGPGGTREVVQDLLGIPEYWTDKDSGVEARSARAFEYVGLLIMFKGNIVESITVSTWADWSLSPLCWEDTFIDYQATAEVLTDYLRSHAIDYTINFQLGLVLDAIICTEGNVFACERYRVDVAEGNDGAIEIKRSSIPYIDTLVSLRHTN